MKRAFLYLFAVLFLSTTLSSCLGESESYTEGTRRFAVVDNINGIPIVRFAIGNGGYPTRSKSNELANYSKGDVVFISYRIDFNSVSNEGIYSAEYLTIAEEDVYRSSTHKRIHETEVDEALNTNPAKFKSLSNPEYSPNEFYLDRWLFSYSHTLKTGQAIDGVEFFYDKDNQGEGLEENTVIVDVRLKLSGEAAAGAEAKTTEGIVIANLGSFRDSLRPSGPIDENGEIVKIRFRYFKESDTEGKPTVTQDIGALLYEPEKS